MLDFRKVLTNFLSRQNFGFDLNRGKRRSWGGYAMPACLNGAQEVEGEEKTRRDIKYDDQGSADDYRLRLRMQNRFTVYQRCNKQGFANGSIEFDVRGRLLLRK